MNSKLTRGLLAGLAATIAMTVFMMIGAKLGMPKMEPPKMLAATMGAGVEVGWIMHFMIGIGYGLLYSFVISGFLTKINSVVGKGFVFGILAFVIAKIGMTLMGKMFPEMPEPAGDMMMIAMAMIIGHVVFGLVAALIVHRK